MGAISSIQIARAYDLAKHVRNGLLTRTQAVRVLAQQDGMDKGSADPYLNAVRHMLEGTPYRRTINQEATRYYLKSIHRDFGMAAGLVALRSLTSHIGYYESIQSATMTSQRNIVAEIQALFAADFSLTKFDLEVEQSLRLGTADRQRLLPTAGTKPEKHTVSVLVFSRNPHVVAEVLTRSNGRCEDCGSPAPFVKRSDGRPYLEVHHRITLAAGGDDTVENSTALCPNCHRRMHYA